MIRISATKSFIAAAVVLLSACTATAQTPNYTVTSNVPEQIADGGMVYLVDYDTKARIDSTLVTNRSVTFEGTIDNAKLVRLIADGGRRLGDFFLEAGNITVTNGDAVGTALNDSMNAFSAKVNEIGARFQEATDEAVQEALYQEYVTMSDSFMKENINNPIGYYMLLQAATEMTRQELDEVVATAPALLNYERIKGLYKVFDRIDATQPGMPFTDFSIEHEGVTYKLSDYVGKGKYVLVDFWASWCGPCMRTMPYLKELHKQYSDKGLEILGVAVWDEPANSLATIERLELPWKQIINAQSIPTDLYGVQGIPSLFLFAPDGTIILRQPDHETLDVKLAEIYADKAE